MYLPLACHQGGTPVRGRAGCVLHGTGAVLGPDRAMAGGRETDPRSDRASTGRREGFGGPSGSVPLRRDASRSSRPTGDDWARAEVRCSPGERRTPRDRSSRPSTARSRLEPRSPGPLIGLRGSIATRSEGPASHERSDDSRKPVRCLQRSPDEQVTQAPGLPRAIARESDRCRRNHRTNVCARPRQRPPSGLSAGWVRARVFHQSVDGRGIRG